MMQLSKIYMLDDPKHQPIIKLYIDILQKLLYIWYKFKQAISMFYLTYFDNPDINIAWYYLIHQTEILLNFKILRPTVVILSIVILDKYLEIIRSNMNIGSRKDSEGLTRI